MGLGWMSMKGQPLVSKVAKVMQYVVFPATMAASLIICPPDDIFRNKKTTTNKS